MLAVKRSHPGFAEDMPVTRSTRQRLEESEDSEGCVTPESSVWEKAPGKQLEGKDVQQTLSIDLAADGSTVALRQPSTIVLATSAEVSAGEEMHRSSTIASTKHTQHGASRNVCSDGAVTFDSVPEGGESDEEARQSSEVLELPELPGSGLRSCPPSETPQSPMRTRAQLRTEAALSQLSSATEELLFCSSASDTGIQPLSPAADQAPACSQEAASPRVRCTRISLVAGAVDGACMTSQRPAAAALKSCLRRISTIRLDSQADW